MAYINFKYNYPYCGYGEKGRFQYQWSESRKTLNGSYTYPLLFNTTVPSCSHIKMDIEIENTGSGTIMGRSWDFMVCKSNGSWVDIKTFTLPSDGKYTIDCDIPSYNISQIACVPTSNPGSSREWTSWYDIQEMTITENITLSELNNDKYFYGVFPNYYGLSKTPVEIYANIDGTLKKAAGINVNVDGVLVSLPKMLTAELKTSSETMAIYKFTALENASYTIKTVRTSGDHEIRLYDSNFTPMTNSYFYSQSFAFTAGSVFYITLTHYYNADASESTLQIYKED